MAVGGGAARKAVGGEDGGPALGVGGLLRRAAESKPRLLARAGEPFQETKANSGEPSCGPGAGLAGAMSQGLRGPAGKPAGSVPPPTACGVCIARVLCSLVKPICPSGHPYSVRCCSFEQ